MLWRWGYVVQRSARRRGEITQFMNQCEIHCFLGGDSQIPVLMQNPLLIRERQVLVQDCFSPGVVNVETVSDLFEHRGRNSGVWGRMGLVNHESSVFSRDSTFRCQVQDYGHRGNITHVVGDEVDGKIFQKVVKADSITHEPATRLNQQMNRLYLVVRGIGGKLKHSLHHALVNLTGKRDPNFFLRLFSHKDSPNVQSNRPARLYAQVRLTAGLDRF